MADEPEVLSETSDAIATITLNRPHRRNAISGRMLGELTDALRTADADPSVRCIILTGAGKGFCSGLDIKDTLAGTGIGSDPAAVGDAGSAINNLPTVVLQELELPVIGVI
ncbi:MAG: enoyl-CoA hydratase/isomerase family protein, partial [Actinomycetota bacterium]